MKGGDWQIRFTIQSERARKILANWNQPLTAAQVGRRIGLEVKPANDLVRKLVRLHLLYCLNPRSRRSRLFWLTSTGCNYQNKLRKTLGLSLYDPSIPNIDWELYGKICFNHRTAILNVLTEPLQPAKIKRKLRRELPHIHINADNVREIIRFFKEQEIVRPVRVRKWVYPRYELTEQGKCFRELLIRAEVKDHN